MSFPYLTIPAHLKEAADQEVAAYCARRTALQAATDSRFRYTHRWDGAKVTIIELSQREDAPTVQVEAPFIELRMRQAERDWTLHHWYWANKWGSYRLSPAGQTVSSLLEEVDRDPHGYFWTDRARTWRMLPKPISTEVKDKVSFILEEFCREKGSSNPQNTLRVSFYWRRNRVTILQHQPVRLEPGRWKDNPVAQFLYDPAIGAWTLSYTDRKLRWQTYNGALPDTNFCSLLSEINEDPMSTFWK